MRAQNHPEFVPESAYLDRTCSAIRKEAASLQAARYDGMTPGAAKAKRSADRERVASIEQVKNAPYFHRTDATIKGKHEELYFGNFAVDFDGIRVVEWQADVAALRYSTREQQAYPAPGGSLQAKVHLQRKLKAASCALVEITDIVDFRGTEPNLKPATQTPEQTVKEILVEALSSRDKAPGLHEFVASMQEQQDRLVRIPSDRALVIQGVAGSGKTSIAYHRIAYLLYQARRRLVDIKAERTVVFAPNRLFLSYVHNLLPELGVQNVQETTFEDWALGLMGLNPSTYEIRDLTLETLIDDASSRDDKTEAWKRARLVTSRRMLNLLGRFIEQRAKEFAPGGSITMTELVERKMVTLEVNEEEVIAEHARVSQRVDVPLSSRRSELVDRLTEMLEDRLVSQPGMTRLEGADLLSDSKSHQRRASVVQTYVDRAWPALRLPKDYYSFLADKESIEALSKGLYRPKEVELIATAPRRRPREIDREDIAPLLALEFMLDGTPGRLFDHVIIDEAQDFSALQYALVKQVSTGDSFTILGDLAQSIHAYRGLENWAVLEGVFEPEAIEYESVLVNYRSTDEIVSLANSLLGKAYGDSAILSRPTGRSGDAPFVGSFGSQEAMFDHVATQVQSDLAEGRMTVAVICKTEAECIDAYKSLESRGVEIAENWLSVDAEYAGGVALLTVSDAKGLEFESVYVVNADRRTFSAGTPFDARLLYVAVTRALDKLHVVSGTSVTALLDGIGRK